MKKDHLSPALSPTGNEHLRFFSALVALAWAGFQLSVARFVLLDPVITRSVHLSFALGLAYLSLSPRRGHRPVSFWALLFALFSAGLALYLVLDQEGMSARSGLPNWLDLMVGMALFLMLLEATRRSIGPALPGFALLFTAYVFLGPWLPGPLAFKGVGVSRFFSQITLSTEGIYGLPLDVSASTVFLFVLLGGLLERAGAGEFFTQIALSLLGGFKGGPAKAAVVSSGMTGLVSGSSIGNIVTTGTFTIPLMIRAGFPPKKAAAVEVAASTDGQLMPPVMGAAAFIIAEYVNLPYLEVAKAALIPALLSYFALFFVVHLEADKLGMKGLKRSERPAFLPLLRAGYLHLIPLLVLGFELVVLRHSPKYAAFTAIFCLLVLLFWREWRQTHSLRAALANWAKVSGAGMIQGSKNMIPVALATASAGIIVGIVGMGLGGMITGWVESLSGGMLIPMLAITAIASLILGMGLPTTATYIVMASLTAPIIVTLGAQAGWAIPLLAAHLFCFYFGILADDTPPVGLASYAAAAIAKTEPIATGLQAFWYHLRTIIIPFMFVLNPELILVGVDSWQDALWIGARASLGSLAFASLLQGWLFKKNQLWQAPFLGFSALTLFHPLIWAGWGLSEIQATGAGLLAFGLVPLYQWLRGR
ncbi:MAG: C4-dicarboxylate ABC transporter [Candidatus Lambdaproteobacteria bacterium RIFOXYD2_FULL_50_16]|uniref:C4-dicarboxylate ABC transporter n=1 Tax=Candidatus Lambdaproteobacteria bacterium RIFOXYD2_FULL_50_16 TaxID=1817772 RepID=A0A1F6GA93_9PROT|nr:MAG: C4-dicarboxylate ABC transporter [Candidatus Lambdaproteobacteria bacterium RIFOXYD2_FULL_50_16]